MRDWTKPEPPPVRTGTQAVWPLIISSLQRGEYESSSTIAAEDALTEACCQRHQLGIQRYGTALEVENGRDPLRDLLDEALDAMAYSRQNYERTQRGLDWELHLLAVEFAARVMGRILQMGAHG